MTDLETDNDAKPSLLMVTGAMRTNVGLVRTNNEDSVAFVLPRHNAGGLPDAALLVVADGMGGHAAGEVASQMAIASLCSGFYDARGDIPDILRTCLQQANAAVYERSLADPACAGMGTTCTAIAVSGNAAYLGHVGDSRAYLHRKGEKMHQISPDHTLVGDLVRLGSITREEAETHEDRNVLVKALGTKPTLEPTVWTEGLPLRAGDILILCSDGLSDLVSADTIERISDQDDPLDACDQLVAAALEAGGYDNISVGVFHIVSPEDRIVRPVHPTRSEEADPVEGNPR
jgi:protein phosphatase